MLLLSEFSPRTGTGLTSGTSLPPVEAAAGQKPTSDSGAFIGVLLVAGFWILFLVVLHLRSARPAPPTPSYSSGYSPWRSAILLGAITAFATFLTIEAFTHGAWEDFDIFCHQASVPGCVIANPEGTFDFQYEFTVNGKKYSRTAHVIPTDLMLKVDEMVDVHYSTWNPSHSCLLPPPNPFIPFGIIWGIVFLCFFVDRRDRTRKLRAQAVAVLIA